MAKAKTQYRVISPLDGTVLDTRTSTSCRIYTHAVAVRLSERYARDLASVWTKHDQRNAEWSWNNAQKIIAKGEDDLYGPKGLERSKEIAAHGSLAAFAQAQLDARIAKHEQDVANGRFTKLGVVGYQGRPDLAQKEHFKQAKFAWNEAVFTIEVERLA